MRLFTKSIRWRLLFWLGLLLATILSGFGLTAYHFQRTRRLNQIDQAAERRLAALSMDFRGPGPNRPGGQPRLEQGPGPGPPDHFGPPHPGGPGNRRLPKPDLSSGMLQSFTGTNGFYFAIWTREGLWRVSSNAPVQLPAPEAAPGNTRTHTRMRGTLRESYHFTEREDCILVGRSIAADLAALGGFAWRLAAAGAGILALGLGGAWVLANRVIRPVRLISAAAGRIAEGNLSERIDVAETDSELGQLARVLNSTFARLEAAFAEQKQFTADASHELRTPLAVLISEAQTTLARPRTEAEYRETVENCLEVAQQMRRLADSLLQLARFDAGQEKIERENFDLAGVALPCVEMVRPLAEERVVRINCLLRSAPVAGDAGRLRQVVTNLLSNAVRYNKQGGEIRVETRTENGHALLVITDTGQGIPKEDLPRVFERFYRSDKSRGQGSGGSGLGLAISKAIVQAHGGTIEVDSEVGVGTSFNVRLPKG